MSTSGVVLATDLIHRLTISSVASPNLYYVDFPEIVGPPEVAFVDLLDWLEVWLITFVTDLRCLFCPSWELCELIRSSSFLAESSESKSICCNRLGRCTAFDRACLFVLCFMPTIRELSWLCFVVYISALLHCMLLLLYLLELLGGVLYLFADSLTICSILSFALL